MSSVQGGQYLLTIISTKKKMEEVAKEIIQANFQRTLIFRSKRLTKYPTLLGMKIHLPPGIQYQRISEH